jgi:hypothetical protein
MGEIDAVEIAGAIERWPFQERVQWTCAPLLHPGRVFAGPMERARQTSIDFGLDDLRCGIQVVLPEVTRSIDHQERIDRGHLVGSKLEGIDLEGETFPGRSGDQCGEPRQKTCGTPSVGIWKQRRQPRDGA